MKQLLATSLFIALVFTGCEAGFAKFKQESSEAINNLGNEAIRIKNEVQTRVDQVGNLVDSVNETVDSVSETVDSVNETTSSLKDLTTNSEEADATPQNIEDPQTEE